MLGFKSCCSCLDESKRLVNQFARRSTIYQKEVLERGLMGVAPP